MGLYENWENSITKLSNKKQSDDFWKNYYDAEQKNYEKILENKDETYEGTVSELAVRFGMDVTAFAGFLDGINTSLKDELDTGSLELDTPIKLEIDFEKLFLNMHEAKADWLYNLSQWDGVLSSEKRAELDKTFKKSKIAVSEKVGRNEPCPCGSGKKYKNCCSL